MPKEIKIQVINQLKEKLGTLHKLENSLSLFDVGDGKVRIYIRYSKIHSENRTWYGLRKEDLQKLEGHNSFICFLWEDQPDPLFILYSEYEEIFSSIPPAGDGQYKVQIILGDEGTELYIPKMGRFNVEGNYGWENIEAQIKFGVNLRIPELSHTQVQTLLGSIGTRKGYDIWIPQKDRIKLDWSLTKRFDCSEILPYGYNDVIDIIQEVDVIWILRGASQIRAFFEIEHSTPIYSGLLRFNDIHLIVSSVCPSYSIVANDTRRALFVRQLKRPTFQVSGLFNLCSFLMYDEVYTWHLRVNK